MDPSERDIEALLQRSRPEPSAAWVTHAERALLPPHTEGRVLWRRPVFRLGTALAGGLASLALVLSLVGVSPLGGNDAVRAKDDCRLVSVTRVERVPMLIVRANGKLHLTHRRERVHRTERRCTQR